MADFCNWCEPEHFDYNVDVMVQNLNENEFVGPFICEGCGLKGIFKEAGQVGYCYGSNEDYKEVFTRQKGFHLRD